MNDNEKPRCPFVYATGKRCCGEITGLKFYGNLRYGYPGVRKVRMWCSTKGDHAGTGNSWVAKERMEFYPDRIPTDLKGYVWGQFEAEHAPA